MAWSEYILADGSPRYGIRTDEVPAEVQAPVAEAKVSAAKYAAGLDLMTLTIAAGLRRRHTSVNGSTNDLKQLRSKHPSRYREAVDAVGAEIGNLRDWRRSVNSRFNDDYDTTAMSAWTIINVFTVLGLLVLTGAMFVASAMLGASPIESLFVLLLGLSISARITKRILPGMGAGRLEDLWLLHQDVVTVTLVDSLAAAGEEVAPEHAAAARLAMERFRAAEAAARTLGS